MQIWVEAGAARDLAGNPCTLSPALERVRDSRAPILLALTPHPSELRPPARANFTTELVWSEEVTCAAACATDHITLVRSEVRRQRPIPMGKAEQGSCACREPP